MGDARLGVKLAEGGLRICREVEANFRAWFERNFANPRAGRIGCVSYSRAGVLDDRPGDGMWYAEALDRAWADYNSPLTASEMGYITDHPLIAFQLATGITDVRGVRCMIRGLTLRTNSLQRKAYRSRYYGQENARRRMLAAERRKITRRTTTNPCPTPEAFREAFAGVKESVEAKLLFGGMVHDLACYVDSCLRYDGAGNIVGRNGGIKAWIAENVPELYPRYKTIMRYKALAMRLRQAMGVKDPEPTSALLDDALPTQGEGRSRVVRKDGDTMDCGAMDCGRDGGTRNDDLRKGGMYGRQAGQGKELETGNDKNYSAQKSYYEEEGNGNCLQEDGNGSGLHGKLYGKQRQARSRREQLHALLDGCANTFKELFGRIDSNLGNRPEEGQFPQQSCSFMAPGQLDNRPEEGQLDNLPESKQIDN